MIIYGSQMYGKKDEVGGWGICPHCGNYAMNKSYTGKKWGHIYFIPLIPMGKKVRVLQECSTCKMGSHIPLDKLEAMEQLWQTLTQEALKSLLAGQTSFRFEGETVEAVPTLLNVMPNLLAVQQKKLVELTLLALQKQGLTYAALLYEGQWEELKGKADAALANYQEAASQQPESSDPLLWQGQLLLATGQPAKARPVYEQAREKVKDPMEVLPHLLDIYENLQEHGAHADTLEEIFQRVPELKQEKSLKKRYKKVCKKAGRDAIAI